MASSSCVSPLHSPYSSFHLSSPVNSHLPTPRPLFCTYAFVSSLPHLLTFHLHSFSPGSSCHPNCPFWLLFSTNSSLVSCLFSFLVFFYVTWHRLPKTAWQLPHSALFFASPLFTFYAESHKYDGVSPKEFGNLFQNPSKVWVNNGVNLPWRA